MSDQNNSTRRLPVRPDLDQLKHQAKDLLKRIRRGEPEVIAEFDQFYTRHKKPAAEVKLADAQFALARSYGATSWLRLVQSCKLIDAIWRDDLDAVRELVVKHPNLLHENAGIRNRNWGPPMTYAANLGRDEIIKMLYDLGARDLESAIDRAVLQSKIGTARMLHELMGSPPPTEGALDGPAYTLSASGTALILELGGRVIDENGRRVAPVDVVLETDSRKPTEKHRILEMYVQHGLELPDTPVMALHRGRIDLLENISVKIRNCCDEHSRTKRSFLPNSGAMTKCSPHKAHRWRGRPCCTCALITTSWRSRAGYWSVEWIRIRGRK